MGRKTTRDIGEVQLTAIARYLDRHPDDQEPMAVLNYARMVTRQLLRVYNIDDPTKEIECGTKRILPDS